MKKLLALAIWLLMAGYVIAQNAQLPTISFSKQQYYLEEGKQVEVCLSLKNVAESSSIQDVFVVNSSTASEFLSFKSKSVPLVDGTFCFMVAGETADGEVTYANTDILQLVVHSDSSEVILTPISQAKVILDDDVSSQASGNSIPLLIKAFDNQISTVGGFSLSLIVVNPLIKGSSFVVSNSNYSESQGWLPIIPRLV